MIKNCESKVISIIRSRQDHAGRNVRNMKIYIVWSNKEPTNIRKTRRKSIKNG